MQPDNNRDRNTMSDLEAILTAMVRKIENFSRGTTQEKVSGYPPLTIHRYEQPTESEMVVTGPAMCLVLQGCKLVQLGKEEFSCTKSQCILTSVDLPITAKIVEASKEAPFLCITLELDKKLLAQIALEGNDYIPEPRQVKRGLAICRVERPLARSLLRMVNLLAHPEEIPILAPLIHREIVYRLLIGKDSYPLSQVAAAGSRSNKIGHVIGWMRANRNPPLKIEELAGLAGMSMASFHKYFKATTTLSPKEFYAHLQTHDTQYCQEEGMRAALESNLKRGTQPKKKYSNLYTAYCRTTDYWN